MFQDRWFDPASTPGLATGNVAITVAGATVGNPNPNSERLDETRYQIVENITLTSGSHTLRLGGDLSRTRDTVDALQSAGAYTYPTLTAFAQDFSGGTARSYTNFTQQFGTSAHAVPYKEVNLYAQDTWKALPKVDFTSECAGTKLSFPSQPRRRHYYETGTIPSSDIAFSPRASLAYLLNDTTVVRAGYRLLLRSLSGAGHRRAAAGQRHLADLGHLESEPDRRAALSEGADVDRPPYGVTDLMYATNKLRNPHTQQATLALEKQLAHSTTVTAEPDQQPRHQAVDGRRPESDGSRQDVNVPHR